MLGQLTSSNRHPSQESSRLRRPPADLPAAGPSGSEPHVPWVRNVCVAPGPLPQSVSATRGPGEPGGVRGHPPALPKAENRVPRHSWSLRFLICPLIITSSQAVPGSVLSFSVHCVCVLSHDKPNGPGAATRSVITTAFAGEALRMEVTGCATTTRDA